MFSLTGWLSLTKTHRAPVVAPETKVKYEDDEQYRYLNVTFQYRKVFFVLLKHSCFVVVVLLVACRIV